MPLVSLKELKQHLPAGKRVMGLDHSRKIWGLALADLEIRLVTPLKSLRCTKFSQDIIVLARLCAEYNVRGFVIGMPYNMDGSVGARAESVRHFGDNVMKAKNILAFDPLIAFQDERLSTHAGNQILIDDLGMNHKKRESVIDAQAAAQILQDALKAMDA